eukprot:gnl/MRDRNA2_/MRDRNA2_61004_c0_seq1.p1 gnl/MRDRNA2_/MRDRNA2_61004_c0~~gnl/MRDRNA2_/MRDRNA2_61004_c0_seq1.p1  ORF type:complete len:223 (-),score=11.82 gnl/MRDRNA2_/MRDRNA2_61004_c0_seq1:345-1013(-)
MCRTGVIISIISSFSQANAQDFTSNSVNKWESQLVHRSLKELPLHDLDTTTLAKGRTIQPKLGQTFRRPAGSMMHYTPGKRVPRSPYLITRAQPLASSPFTDPITKNPPSRQPYAPQAVVSGDFAPFDKDSSHHQAGSLTSVQKIGLFFSLAHVILQEAMTSPQSKEGSDLSQNLSAQSYPDTMSILTSVLIGLFAGCGISFALLCACRSTLTPSQEFLSLA